MKQLIGLNLTDTRVGEAAVEELRKALPKCEIIDK
jgi:hypothetical protein